MADRSFTLEEIPLKCSAETSHALWPLICEQISDIGSPRYLSNNAFEFYVIARGRADPYAWLALVTIPQTPKRCVVAARATVDDSPHVAPYLEKVKAALDLRGLLDGGKKKDAGGDRQPAEDRFRQRERKLLTIAHYLVTEYSYSIEEALDHAQDDSDPPKRCSPATYRRNREANKLLSDKEFQEREGISIKEAADLATGRN